MTTIRSALFSATQQLKASGIDGPARDARVLLAGLLGGENSVIALDPEQILSAPELATFEAAIRRRCHHEPVSKILGVRQFWGRPFTVTKDVLDPRPETEILIAKALKIGPVSHFFDMGTGSGAIAVTLLAEWPDAKATAADVSERCLAVTQINAEAHQVDDRLTTVTSNWFEKIAGPVPLIVSNPPYIGAAEMDGLSRDVRDYDPEIALTDFADGLSAYRALAAGAVAHLTPGGHLIVEIGPSQATDVVDIFTAAGLKQPSIHPDFDGRDRVISAQSPL